MDWFENKFNMGRDLTFGYLLTLELVTSRVTLLGGSDGVDENVLTRISAEESPIPFRLKGTTEIT